MKSLSCFLLLFFGLSLSAQTNEVKIKILQTSDIHGNYFPHDFIQNQPSEGSLARISSYLKQERKKHNDHLIMLDNGDILQGQPSAYYYNFIDTLTPHLCARILNYMQYNAGSMGNHDIETGPNVYDRLVRQSDFPWLAANAVRDASGESYFTPYSIYEIDGIKIAVLGMITPAIPTWLPKQLWPDMHFNDIRSTAQKWLPVLKQKEKADIIIGLLHLGTDSRIVFGGIDEGGGLNLAQNIPGFNIIMLGHDHRRFYQKTADINGDSVVVINPGANGETISDVEITITRENGKITKKEINGQLISMQDQEPDPDFMNLFATDYQNIQAFVSKKLGTFSASLSSRDAYTGPSVFVDLIHRIQLDLTHADISFAAPLSFDTKINKGDIFVSDMFKLYKYENFLYTMKLSGKEIKDFLESCYGIWMNQMKSENDHILSIEKEEKTNRWRFKNASYNFDSAAGISYTVDISKPAGNRITIDSKMNNGKTFDLQKEYTVAVNSYRGNGGGGHLTEGAGIPLEELSSRIIYSTPVDLRYYMIQWIEQKQKITPEIISNWKVVPEKWTKKAFIKDYALLFPEKEETVK